MHKILLISYPPIPKEQEIRAFSLIASKVDGLGHVFINHS